MPQYLAFTKCLCRLKYFDSSSTTWSLSFLNAIIPGCPVHDSPGPASTISIRSVVPCSQAIVTTGLVPSDVPPEKEGEEDTLGPHLRIQSLLSSSCLGFCPIAYAFGVLGSSTEPLEDWGREYRLCGCGEAIMHFQWRLSRVVALGEPTLL